MMKIGFQKYCALWRSRDLIEMHIPKYSGAWLPSHFVTDENFYWLCENRSSSLLNTRWKAYSSSILFESILAYNHPIRPTYDQGRPHPFMVSLHDDRSRERDRIRQWIFDNRQGAVDSTAEPSVIPEMRSPDFCSAKSEAVRFRCYFRRRFAVGMYQTQTVWTWWVRCNELDFGFGFGTFSNCQLTVQMIPSVYVKINRKLLVQYI